MPQMQLTYLSHGITETGGYRHERFLVQTLEEAFHAKGYATSTLINRKKKFYSGMLDYFRLLWFGFASCRKGVNIVVARLGVSAMLRGIFLQSKTLIVIHYDDDRDGKSFFLKCYYRLLFYLLRSGLRNVAVIAVAPFWVDYFQAVKKVQVPVFLFPNFFDTDAYKQYQHTQKKAVVNLGQYSFKNDPAIFELAEKLHQKGIESYFSTLIPAEARVEKNYKVICEPREAFMQRMASSIYTIAYISINEGWNRLVHESILAGTPAIGVEKGGLNDLLTESGGLKANTVDEFVQQIESGKTTAPADDFIRKYDQANASAYISSILAFCIAWRQ